MRKTKTQKIADIDLQIANLIKEKNGLLKAQREIDEKARTNRLCKRAGYLEKLLPETIPLSDARFFTFLEKTINNSFGHKILAELTAEQEKEETKKCAVTDPQGGEIAAHKPAVTEQGNNNTPDDKPAEAKQNGGDTPAVKPANTTPNSGNAPVSKPANTATNSNSAANAASAHNANKQTA